MPQCAVNDLLQTASMHGETFPRKVFVSYDCLKPLYACHMAAFEGGSAMSIMFRMFWIRRDVLQYVMYRSGGLAIHFEYVPAAPVKRCIA
jgi:hypothetical protein